MSGAAPVASDPGPASGPAVALAAPAVLASAAADSVPMSELRATSDPPWNPERPVPRRRAWEMVLLAPQRVASIPLTTLGILADELLLYVEETAVVGKFAYVSRLLPERTGIGLRAASLGDRTGLGIRIDARTPFLAGRFRNLLTVSHSLSTRSYHHTVVDLRGAEYSYEWRPQERFHGIGMESAEDSLTSYASRTEHARITAALRWNLRPENGKPRTEAAAWIGPRSLILRSGREVGLPDVDRFFPAQVAATLDRRIEHLVYGARFASDWRMGRPHWSEGWRMLLEIERHDEPREAIALRTTRTGAAFTRATVELESAYSFMRDPRTLRILGRVVDQTVTGPRERMAIPDLASLGGREGLRGFTPGRFHDVDALFARLTYVFPLQRMFEIDLHAETGGVFADVWQDARLSRFRESYGVALRGRTADRPIGSVGFDFSKEAVRFRFSLGSPE